MSIFRELVEPKIVKILELLLANKSKYFHLQKIAEDAKVPLASTFRIVRRLVSLNLVEQLTIGKMKIYKIAGNEKTRELDALRRKR